MLTVSKSGKKCKLATACHTLGLSSPYKIGYCNDFNVCHYDLLNSLTMWIYT